MAQNLTGYPSIDKPWMKYYSKEAINAPLPECTMYEYLRNNNQYHQDDVAIVYFGKEIKYRELFEKIDQTAAAFIEIGVKKGDVVTIQSLTLPQVVYALYALSKIGAIANIIYATSTPTEIKENLLETGSKIFVVMEPIYHKLKAGLENIDLDRIIVMPVQEEMDFVTKTIYTSTSHIKSLKSHGKMMPWRTFYNLGKGHRTPTIGRSEDLVIMVYTGGTTGKSKGVMLSNFNINVGALQYLYLGFERGKTMLCALPPFIAFGITVTLHTPLSFGMKTAICMGADITDVSGFLKKYKPNYVICGVVHIKNIREAFKKKKIDLSFLDCLSVGGDVLQPKTEEIINEFLIAKNAKIQLAQGYAMSETAASTAASTYTVDNIVYKKGTIGVPLVYTNVKIVDPDTQQELGYNENGEICLSGPCTMMGYYKNEDETNNVLRKHEDGLLWVHTGDIGNVDKDGFITIVGRIKRMIVTFENGIFHKVFPKLLEDEFMEIEGVQAITIVGKTISNDSNINELVAYVVLENGMEENVVLDNMQRFANEKLESYERPSNYVFIEKLPRTTIGKVDYRELEKRAAETR